MRYTQFQRDLVGNVVIVVIRIGFWVGLILAVCLIGNCIRSMG